MPARTNSLLAALVCGTFFSLGAPSQAAAPQDLATGAVAHFTLHEQAKPAPELNFQNPAGQALSLEDFRGKVVLLNLWATWCAPCRREMKDLDALQAELGGPDFEVVALSVDRGGFAEVDPFFAEQGLEHLARYNTPSMRVLRELGILGLPATLLLDGEGRELGRLIGPAEWASVEAVRLIQWHIDRARGAPRSTRGSAPPEPSG